MEELRKLMEDYDRKEVTDEMIIAAYSEINSGHRVSLKEAVISRFLISWRSPKQESWTAA